MLGVPHGFYYPPVTIKMEAENKRGRGRRAELSQAEPSHPSPYGLEATGQTAKQGVVLADSVFVSM